MADMLHAYLRHSCVLALSALGLTLSSCQSPPMNYANYARYSEGSAPLSWDASLRRAIATFDAQSRVQGSGAYSTRPEAQMALHSTFDFARDEPDLYFYPQRIAPSYCSGAVHAAVLAGLMNWDATRPDFAFTEEQWQHLVPRACEDGERVWGWANANGPGYAVLVHALGAGYSFTSPSQARPLDIVKMWWTDDIGGAERGHLAILIANKRDEIVIWGSHDKDDQGREGIYYKTIPKSKIKRILFTRITQPEAFARAKDISYNSWLNGLLRQPTSWAECLRRAGIR